MDRYNIEHLPWSILQQLVINDLILWSHDVSADNFYGWQQIEHYVLPTETQVRIKIRAVAQSPPDQDLDWSNVSLTGIRNFSLEGCP